MPDPRTDAPFLLRPAAAFGKPVCRLGLASHGDTSVTPDDIRHALGRGVNFLNWAGDEDVFSRTIAELGPKRDDVIVCVQFGARTAADAAAELRSVLTAIKSDYVDILTFYYVEERAEWAELTAADGALAYCRAAQRDGRVRRLGVTSHQRPLAADMAGSGLLDLLMIRYNAAHRGAETEVFPVTDALGMPVIAYTALRWGGLLRPTPDDPPGFTPPAAPLWYRFALQHPAVTVALAAPHDRRELEEDLTVLDASGPLTPEEYERLAEHGRRVRRHAGQFS
jgi:predicted aldo/keto reductase-like oxidoreductase